MARLQTVVELPEFLRRAKASSFMEPALTGLFLGRGILQSTFEQMFANCRVSEPYATAAALPANCFPIPASEKLDHALFCERRGIGDKAGRRCAGIELQAHEVLGRRSVIAQSVISLETKAAVVGRIPQDNAAVGTLRSKVLKTCSDQRRPNSQPLMTGFDRYRCKPEPSVTRAGDSNRREGDMTDQCVAVDRNQRNGKIAGCSQFLD